MMQMALSLRQVPCASHLSQKGSFVPSSARPSFIGKPSLFCRRNGSQRRQFVISAATAAADSTDLGALFSDALGSPIDKVGASKSAVKAAETALQGSPGTGQAASTAAQGAADAANTAAQSQPATAAADPAATASNVKQATGSAFDRLRQSLSTGSNTPKPPAATSDLVNAASDTANKASTSTTNVTKQAAGLLDRLNQKLNAGSGGGSSTSLTAKSAAAPAIDSATSAVPATKQAANSALESATQAASSAADSTATITAPAANQAAGSASQKAAEALQSGSQSGGASATQSAADRVSDAAVQSFGDAASSLGDAATSSSDAAAGPDLLDSTSGNAQLTISAVQDSAQSTISAVQDSAQSAAASLQNSAQSAITSAQDAVSGLFGNVNRTASELLDTGKTTVDGLQSGMLNSTESFRSAADGSLAVMQSQAEGLLSSAGIATADVQKGITELTDAVESSTAGIRASAANAIGQAVGQLPPPVQDALYQAKAAVAGAASSLADTAAANPSTTALAVLPIVGASAFLWIASLFDGYGGDLSPANVNALLQEEEALLVDIRSEADRRSQGLPELKRGALGKGAVVPFYSVPFPSRVRRAGALAAEATALTISKLGRLQPTVIILDRGDGKAPAVAKQLAKLNNVQRTFVVQGGFKRWSASGQGVDKERVDYDVSQLALLGNRTSIFAEDTATFLRNPVYVTLLGLTAAFAAGLAIDWHHTLQYVGVSSLIFSAAWRAISYERPEDLVEDVSGLSASVAGTIGGPLQVISGTTKQALSIASSVIASQQQQEQQQPPAQLSQPVQPTQPVEVIAAGAAEEEPATFAGTSGSGGENGSDS